MPAKKSASKKTVKKASAKKTVAKKVTSKTVSKGYPANKSKNNFILLLIFCTLVAILFITLY